MRDLSSNLTPSFSIDPVSSNSNANGAAIDVRGFQGALVEALNGIGGITFNGSNKVEFKLEHSDTTTSADFTAVAAGDILLGTGCDATLGAGGIFRSLIVAQAAGAIARASYLGIKRYIRVVVTFTGTHGTVTPIAALIHRGKAANSPVT